MAKYLAGKLVKVGQGHYNEGDELPADVQIGKETVPLEKLSNFDECVKDGTFKLASSEAHAAAPSPKPSAKPSSKPQ